MILFSNPASSQGRINMTVRACFDEARLRHPYELIVFAAFEPEGP